MQYVTRPSLAPFGPHGVGWAFLDHEGKRPIRVIAMGVVKSANDDEAFYAALFLNGIETKEKAL